MRFHIVLGFTMGVLIASMGYPVTTWQWWCVMIILNLNSTGGRIRRYTNET